MFQSFSEIWSRYKILVVIGVALLAGLGATASARLAAQPVPTMEAVEVAPVEELTIDVEGAVAAPGVRKIAKGSLLEDALAQAGGLTEQADHERVAREMNRADTLKDHQKIYIPAQGEMAVAPSAAGAPAGGVVNLNTATAAELDTLPGIGPTTAEKILNYRATTGPFGATEELKNVPGISDAKYEQLQDKVTV